MTEEIERWFAWRDEQRKKHRYMTIAQYRAWIQGGDVISHPSEANAFPGGITIDFSKSAIIGNVGDEP